MEYEITYTGMDGRHHTESHVGDEQSMSRLVTFLEERGAHCISADEVASPPAVVTNLKPRGVVVTTQLVRDILEHDGI